MKRNVNLIRPIYAPKAGIPFTKPRYILEGEQLRLINVPTPEPENLIALLETLATLALIIRPDRAMLREAQESGLDTLFVGHYSATGNRIVAETITESIVKQHPPGH